MRGAIKTRLCKKFSKSELDDVTRDSEQGIAQLELLRCDLQKLGIIIDDVEMMTHVLSNLTEEYKNVVETFEKKMDDDINILTMERIRDKLSARYDRMNTWSNQNEGKESDKRVYVCQIKVTCYNCGKYDHKSRDCMKGKENKYCMYWKKYRHSIEDCYSKKKYGQECMYCHNKGH